MSPDINDLIISFTFCYNPLLVLILYRINLFLRGRHHLFLINRYMKVVDRDRKACQRGIFKTYLFHAIQKPHCNIVAKRFIAIRYHSAKIRFFKHDIHKRHTLREYPLKNHPPWRCLYDLSINPYFNLRMQVYFVVLKSDLCLGDI